MQLCGIPNARGREIEGERGEIGLEDLRSVVLAQERVLRGVPESVADARGEASGAPAALICG
jgi:hypothetical protein